MMCLAAVSLPTFLVVTELCIIVLRNIYICNIFKFICILKNTVKQNGYAHCPSIEHVMEYDTK